ncbi:hypothetical protein K1719_046756 [Acacia pycnantha]|nr:hypothetical protein K1719_046756 [Acacia pycnantha]
MNSSSSSSYDSFASNQTSKENEDLGQKKISSGRKNCTFAYRIREHVKLGPKLSETVKGKLSLGSKIIHEGVLFISTQKIAFCSERPLNFSSSPGDSVRAPYKVLIPIGKIKEANESENENKTEQKYIQIVTKEGSEFWFLGFLRYEKALTNLQKAISMATS